MKEIKIKKLNEIIYYENINNLDIYLCPNKNVNSYYATLNVRYGSIDTSFNIGNKKYQVPNGTAHFLEHVTFNEGDNLTAHDFYAKKGATCNAFTTFDYTSYEVYAKDNVEENVYHLLEFVLTPYLTSSLVEKERGIITSEVKMNKNDPSSVRYFSMMKNVYQKSNRRYEITGNISDVAKIKMEDIELIYKYFYHPSNMFLIVTGNFNPYELLASLKENFGLIKYPKYNKPNVIYPEEPLAVTNKYYELNSSVNIPKIDIVYKINRHNFKNITNDNLSLYLRLIMTANFGSTSDFKDNIISHNLASYSSFSVIVLDDYVMLSISVETKYPHEILEEVEKKMRNLNINLSTLNRKIKCAIADYIASFDNIETVSYMFQRDILNNNKININLYNDLKNINIDIAKKIINNLVLDNYSVNIQKKKTS